MLKDATYPRMQAMNPHETTHPPPSTEWTDSNGYNTRLFPTDDLQTTDMGQLWLWESGPYSEDMSNWGELEYHI